VDRAPSFSWFPEGVPKIAARTIRFCYSVQILSSFPGWLSRTRLPGCSVDHARHRVGVPRHCAVVKTSVTTVASSPFGARSSPAVPAGMQLWMDHCLGREGLPGAGSRRCADLARIHHVVEHEVVVSADASYGEVSRP